ncbi:inner membrane peptidase [Volucribacter psittacicida]|uniref:Inner membrane peptidase n=1 Tax=Volucribacter psittacicida TaxID=203482 RepID=A0A4R1G5M2_9PAST|nr:protease SohB [Volucribacter psittacicida]TCK01800.1 inner membrane peptidase [Volucribacter psittacicida]
MWSELALGYGLFILQILTIIVVIGVIFAIIIGLKQKGKLAQGELEVIDLAEQYQKNQQKLADFQLSEQAAKAAEKDKKKADKLKAKAEKERLKNSEKNNEQNKPHLYVLSFKGDIQASATTALREEINAIIAVAKPEQDEVLLRLESPGGVVHGYGLAASQLNRLKQHGIKLTVAVDKVAASGGYMMACVADKIVAAPFAIIGSIGVVAQVPNIHRLLKKNDIDVEVMTAGEYKRTLTVLGENTEKGKQKFQQELQETHDLFKQFVAQQRRHLAIDQVATGEHWFGQQAIELQLVDEIATSDDLILAAIKEKSVLAISYKTKKSLLQKFGKQAEESADNLLTKLLNRQGKDFY